MGPCVGQTQQAYPDNAKEGGTGCSNADTAETSTGGQGETAKLALLCSLSSTA